ncbi:putative disease resistance protein At3g14460 [Juglans regia]|nr:putative disease resistance protein At3g14460 [Juglans regia]XP_035541906.1 putative disease resistance protein At3g14460 [Juglans regia]XP_035541907.1 putative disease resistance protein At3g14460 [Juglans regia]XP_035541908.1 putative disease resistance protein At3g14460 [Juglans regia]XP_035541909.1 putative disease resistance protein At3g14460 [Juglans regia]XP_035541910.1 putative disease resistance protein At3g14460 [Juglans regia]
MGGIGKTTLAQLVYNDKKVESFFNLKAWACVSEDFDVAAVTKTILQSLTSENCGGKDLNWLQVKLKEKLLGKRFLVILDDVWNEKYDDWIRLRAPFKAGAPGSSIIVTTRNKGVSSLMRNKEVEPFQLKLLSNEACLSIFTQHALEARDFSAHPNLKDIGEELVRRCKGLPLAVKTIAGVLRSEDEDRNEWEKVLKNKIWDIPVEVNGIPSSLMVSYDNLSSHLKRCFAYCSILPKDYEFEEKEVVLLWMAEGLIQPLQDHEEEMEDLGSKYFRNLLSRSFFQQSRINESQFVMHDLINDLAQSVAGNTCFRMEDRVGGTKHENSPIKARHSSYLGSKFDATKKFEVFSKFTSLRTFLPLMLPCPGYCYLAHHVPFELVPTLRCLRVLSFNGYCIMELSDSIGDLKHLRYLNLSHTRIRFLPESITSLYNLQTLLLERCICLKKLPSMFRNLVNLRHLNIEDADNLEGMPMQIGKLTCLQTLSNLVLGKESSCSGIKELGPLNHLRGTLCISRLENMIEPKDAKDAELNKKTKISGLWLKWSKYIDESKDMTSELEVLNGLWPHDALTKLVIINYGGTRFPNWLTSPSFPHMVSLRLENCYNCTSLPPLGQYLPSLKNLWIEGMAKVKSVGFEFCGSNLETLHFHDMEKWENWNPCEEFPNLHELSLLNCPKLLGKLPNNHPLLNKVVINDCAQLVVSLSCFPDKCKFNIEESEMLDMEGMVCGSKATFKLIELSRSLSPISDMEGLAELEWLRIKNCEELTNLWFDNKGSLPHLPFLRRLDIYNCPKLLSLVVEEVDQERLQLSLPKALMYNNTCLQSIDIFNCDSLTHFARSHLPPTLKRLHISNCRSMRNLVEDDENDTKNSSEELPTLEILSVCNCPSLEFLTSSGELPTTLQSLSIQECPKLESVAKSFHHNLFLKTITISDCEKMQGLQNCIHNLTSLRDLKIRNCPSILSFPKEGFPTNLTTLMISHHKFTDALFDWGLNNLTSLHELHIGGSQHLECLPFEGLRKLTSLKTLWIFDCENLACFPEDGLPSSLLELNISNCQKFMSFPKNGLPPSLQQLAIYECPLLEERCKKDQRGEWRRIADIPYVEINGKYLYET